MDDVNLFAGFDVSTQGCKLVVVDPVASDVVYLESLNYDDDLPHYGTRLGTIPGLGDGVSESDPRMWIEAVSVLLARLSDSDVDTGAIRCISVSGQQHGLVALDEDGELARPRSKLWNDFSTRRECADLTEAVGGLEAMIELVANSQRTGYTAGKILHLVRHEPETWARTATVMVVHNYVNRFLTGGVEVMEPGDTSGTALWHPATGEFARPVLEAIAPDLAEKLPPVHPATATIGVVSPALAARYGLSGDCRVDAGSGDNMYAAVGTGNYRTGIVTVSLGTSGTAAVFMEEPFSDPTGEIASYCDSTGNYLALLCVSNLANGYNAVRDRFGLSHAQFDALLEETEPGNGGRLLLPWFSGERTPDLPEAAAVWFGFAPEEFIPARLARAVLEGHVHGLRAGYRRLPAANRIHVTGGLARSPSWRQALADVFGVEVIPAEGEGAALGAALHAAWVWRNENGRPCSMADVADPFVRRLLREDLTARPRPEWRETYRAQRRLYRALSQRVRGLPGEDPMELRTELRGLRGS